MKLAANIAGGFLGFLFVAFTLLFLAIAVFKVMPMPAPPAEGTPAALFMGAMMPTGYMYFVKACELIGGVLVAFPKTRNFGLLVLGPILINILAFHVFIDRASLGNPVLIVMCLLALFLLWCDRRKFLALLN